MHSAVCIYNTKFERRDLTTVSMIPPLYFLLVPRFSAAVINESKVVVFDGANGGDVSLFDVPSHTDKPQGRHAAQRDTFGP